MLEPFTRGARASAPGSGLGMAIVAQQAALHDGDLELGQSGLGGLSARLRLQRAAAPAPPRGGDTPVRFSRMIHHVGFEVADLGRSGRFYDAVFFALGVRRLHENQNVIGWGITEPVFWLTARNPPAPAYGHIAFRATGKVAVQAAHAAGLRAGGSDDGAPGPRAQYGPRYYAAYLRDPDGLRVEVVASDHG